MDTGISLLKKGQKGFFHAVFSRLGLIVLLLAAQALPGPGWGLEQGFRLWGGLPGIPASG